ncbi:MAG: hypothetical protein EOP84_10945 [Verrucomicrobiaceae bacterium]|nr:MAG: hypothetical protein EOP84_10945 [Verrucomicrobiaceae bacterium]
MRKTVGWLVWFGMVSISAGEIMAWKVPLERYSYQSMPGKPLENPPEASVFFRPGDELRDTGKVNDEDSPQVEWAVWNATTRTLVTKSSSEEIWPLLLMLDPEQIPRQCQLQLDVFDTTDDSPPATGKVPAFSLKWIARSGTKSSVANETKGKQIDANAEVTLDETGEVVYLSLEGAFKLPGQDRLKLKSHMALKSGSTVQVAGDRSGGKGMEVTLTANTVLMDGTPLADCIQIQRDGQSAPFYRPRLSSEKYHISNRAWLFLGGTDLEPFLDAAGPLDEKDPFAEPTGEKPEKRKGLRAVEVPDSIAGRVHGPVLDIHETMIASEIQITEGVDFVGYDLMSQSVVFLTASESQADKMHQLLSPGCGLPLRNVSASCESIGSMHVTSRSTKPAYVERGTDDKNPIRRFDIEPVIGENDYYVQLAVRYSDRSSPDSHSSLDTTVTIESANPLQVFSGGAGTPLKLSATVVGE